MNKFSYLGSRLVLAYDEIIGLIKDNDKLTGQLSNRDATFFKAQGKSRGILFWWIRCTRSSERTTAKNIAKTIARFIIRTEVRQTGGTCHIERHRQSSTSGTSTPAEILQDRDTLSAGLQVDLIERERRLRDRQQQTGDAHRQEITRQGTMPTLQRCFCCCDCGSFLFFHYLGFCETCLEKPLAAFPLPVLSQCVMELLRMKTLQHTTFPKYHMFGFVISIASNQCQSMNVVVQMSKINKCFLQWKTNPDRSDIDMNLFVPLQIDRSHGHVKGTKRDMNQ